MIVVHAGNRIDEPHRPSPRFPAHREQHVAGRIGALLDLLQPLGVVTAAAAGADLLVAEAALERRIPLHLVLPFDRDRFAATSVADQGERWSASYRRLLAHVASDPRCSLAELGSEDDDDGFRACNSALLERAAALSPQRVLAVAVRPRATSSPPSMTDDFVDRAEAAGVFVVEIDPGR